MRRSFLLGTSAVVLVICRFALGAETSGGGPGDPVNVFWKMLLESGVWGLFLGYMIFRDCRREKKEEAASDRFHALDKLLVSVIENNTGTIEEFRTALHEMREFFIRENGAGARRATRSKGRVLRKE